jgi:hypothetical protein
MRIIPFRTVFLLLKLFPCTAPKQGFSTIQDTLFFGLKSQLYSSKTRMFSYLELCSLAMSVPLCNFKARTFSFLEHCSWAMRVPLCNFKASIFSCLELYYFLKGCILVLHHIAPKEDLYLLGALFMCFDWFLVPKPYKILLPKKLFPLHKRKAGP